MTSWTMRIEWKENPKKTPIIWPLLFCAWTMLENAIDDFSVARRGVKVRNSYNFANRWQNAGEKIRYYILVLLIHCYCFGFCSLQRFICFSIYYCSTKCIHCSCQSPSRFLSHMSNMFQPSLVQAHPFKIESIVQRPIVFFLKPKFSQLTR